MCLCVYYLALASLLTKGLSYKWLLRKLCFHIGQ